MRIGIDARFLTHPQAGGFKAYTQNLIASLAEVDAANEYILYVDRPPSGVSLPACNFQFRVVSGTKPLVGMPWREQIGLARQASQDRLDLWHSLCLTAPLRLPCRSVVTVHDMIWAGAQAYGRAKKAAGKRSLMDRYFRYVIPRAARRADAVITVSQAAKESIVAEMGMSPERIFVTPEAAGSHFRPLPEDAARAAVARDHGLVGGYVLALGAADPRKNVAGLVQAYAALPSDLQEQYPLAIIWSSSALVDGIAQQIAALGIADNVRSLHRVSDEALVQLYNAATLFVFPSFQEGFGLPVLEAMACGTPVVASDNSSIPEVAGQAAVLVPASDTQALTAALARVLTDARLQRQMKTDGLAQAALFSWERCARETIALYSRLGKS